MQEEKPEAMTIEKARIQRENYLRDFKGFQFTGYPKIQDFIIIPVPITISTKELAAKYQHGQVEFVDNNASEYELLTVFELRNPGDFFPEKTTTTMDRLNSIK